MPRLMARVVEIITCLGSSYGTMPGALANIMARAVACVTCPSTGCGTMVGALEHIMACVMCHVSWLRLPHHGWGLDTRHGMASDTSLVSWYEPWHYAKNRNTRYSTTVTCVMCFGLGRGTLARVMTHVMA